MHIYIYTYVYYIIYYDNKYIYICTHAYIPLYIMHIDLHQLSFHVSSVGELG